MRLDSNTKAILLKLRLWSISSSLEWYEYLPADKDFLEVNSVLSELFFISLQDTLKKLNVIKSSQP